MDGNTQYLAVESFCFKSLRVHDYTQIHDVVTRTYIRMRNDMPALCTAHTVQETVFSLVILNCNLKYGSLVFGVPKCTCMLIVLDVYAHGYEHTQPYADWIMNSLFVSFLLFCSHRWRNGTMYVVRK